MNPIEQNVKRRSFFKERRKRLKTPISVIMFGGFFILIPFINYISISIKFKIPLIYWDIIFQNMEVLNIIISILALPVGYGLLKRSKRGWQYFMIYSTILFIYKLSVFVIYSSIYNINAVIQSFFALMAIIFFTSKDIVAPYFNSSLRGWRLHLRRRIRMNIGINNSKYPTQNLTAAGAFLLWNNCSLKCNKELNIEITLNKNNYIFKAGIARIENNGIGIGFRYVPVDIRKKFHRDLQLYEKLKFEKKMKSNIISL